MFSSLSSRAATACSSVEYEYFVLGMTQHRYGSRSCGISQLVLVSHFPNFIIISLLLMRDDPNNSLSIHILGPYHGIIGYGVRVVRDQYYLYGWISSWLCCGDRTTRRTRSMIHSVIADQTHPRVDLDAYIILASDHDILITTIYLLSTINH